MADRQKKTGQKPTTKRTIKASDITKYKQIEKAVRQREMILNFAGEGILGLDLQGKHTFVNPIASKMLGYEVEELIDKPSHAIWHHSKADGSPYPEEECPVYMTHKDGEIRHVRDEVFWRKDGTCFPVAYTSTPIIENGNIVGAVITFRDITERKKNEKALSEAVARAIEEKSKTESIISAIGSGISIQDNDFKILYQNQFMKDLIGDHVGKYCYTAYEHREHVCEGCPMAMSFKDGKIHKAERSTLTDKGTLHVEITTSPLRDVKGEIIGGIEVVRDITEEKCAQMALDESEKKYRNLVDNALVGVYRTNLKGDFLYANDALVKMFEFESPEEMMSESIFARYKNLKDRDVFNENLKITARVENFETELITKKGKTRDVLLSAILEGDVISGMIIDFTERKQIGHALLESEEKFRTITTSAMDAITMMDNEGNVSFWNKAAEDIFGYSSQEILGKELHIVLAPQNYHEAFREGFKEFKNTGQGKAIGKTLELTAVKKDGTEIPIELSVSAVKLKGEWNAIGILRDISERKQAEKQIQHQLQKLAALREIDRAISSSLDLYVTLKIFLDELIRQLHIDAADVLLLNPYTQTLEYTAGRGFHSKAVERSRVYLGEGHAGRSALKRRLIKIPNLSEAPGDLSRFTLLEDEGFVTYHVLPLIAKGQVKGVLEIFHRTLLDPDQEWINFLEALAGQAAIAIDNAELFNSMQRANVELTLAYDTTLEGWSRALDMRDKETEGHTQRVAEMTLLLARAMKMGEAEMMHIRRGALLHDIGKMGVPDSILQKPGPLTVEEWEIMRKHPVYAFEMLSPIHFLRPAMDIPYCHHEKWDGTGYPRGLKGELIPLSSRIFSVVDVWDALRSDRPYRPAWPEDKVREYIRELAGKDFDPKIVEVFLEAEKEW